MNQIQAPQRFRALNAPTIETRDALALLAVSHANANIILKRLAVRGMRVHLARGHGLTRENIARHVLPEFFKRMLCRLCVDTVSPFPSRAHRADSRIHLRRDARTASSPRRDDVIASYSGGTLSGLRCE